MRQTTIVALSASFTILAQAQTVSYRDDVEPVLVQKCVACHACYDAPCQLNLSSVEGLERGASQALVYDGTRTKAQPTTRLYLDAQTQAQWRRQGFNSVLSGEGVAPGLIQQMLELGRAQPLPANSKIPEQVDISITRSNTCPLPGEFATYANKNPHGGMPFAVTGLTDAEYATLNRWLEQGAPIEQESLPVINTIDQRAIEGWEALFNEPGARQNLVARWLYEHLFLAHLYFSDKPEQFYQVVRSRTPSGQAVDPIATRRPNDDPGTRFYYRITPVRGVIVHKTHITLALTPTKLERVREQFLGDNWTLDAVPGYGAQRRANPFETFAAIPAKARYEFMLENAEYFVRTFIRGPVCRGQIATDVIRDNFWVMFQEPAHDLYITDQQYREAVTPDLSMPGQFDDIGDLPGLWRAYRNKRNDYEDARREAYSDAPAPSWSDIWRGNDNALLSIFRQHDSASVRKGLIGGVPQTLWLMDYPLFERTYYQLVVNFDVFGNVSHQAQTRLYFDLIRNGAEVNFLRLLPPDSRRNYLDDWYRNSGKLKMWLDYTDIDRRSATGIALDAEDPKEEFAAQLQVRLASVNARPDPINQCPATGQCYREGLSGPKQAVEQSLSRLSNRPAAGLPAIKFLPEATLLRISYDDRIRNVYSVLRNRAHTNVAFMLGEEMRYEPGLDTLSVFPEVMTSYPNFIFNIPAGEVGNFVSQMEAVRGQEDFDHLVERYGVRRTHPHFWEIFHDVGAYLGETQPIEAGLLDMNRYENL